MNTRCWKQRAGPQGIIRVVSAWNPITWFPEHNSLASSLYPTSGQLHNNKSIIAKCWHCNRIKLCFHLALPSPLLHPLTAAETVLFLKSWKPTSLAHIRNLTWKCILSKWAHLHKQTIYFKTFLIFFLWGLMINLEIFTFIISILLTKIICKPRKLVVPKYLFQS